MDPMPVLTRNADGTVTPVGAGAPLPVTYTAAGTVLNASSTAYTASGQTADLAVGAYAGLAVDVNVTAVTGTSPSCAFVLERKGADGVYYAIASPAAVTAPRQVSLSVGTLLSTPAALGSVVRLRWVITGTTPSFTFTASAIGK